MKRWMYLLLAAGFIGASILSSAQQSAPAPDTILFNGKIITVDDQFSIAQAVAVRGDRIVAVGTNQNIQRLAGPNTQRIDLRGRSVVPGLIDNHAHFQEEGAYWTLELRFDGVDSRKQALEMIRAKAKATAPGKWVFNLGGWSPDQFTDDKKPFTREELDKVSPDNPVFLQFTRSAQYLNSKAIDVLGLEQRKEPWIERDAKGRATGITGVAGRNMLFDQAGFLDAPNGGKANLPMDVIIASQKVMLRDLNKAGLTASGGPVFMGRPVSAVPARGDGKHAVLLPEDGCRRRSRRRSTGEDDRPASHASLPRRRRVDGQLELRRAVPRWRWRRRYRARPRAHRCARGMGRMGPLRARCRESWHPRAAPHGDGNCHRRAAHAA